MAVDHSLSIEEARDAKWREGRKKYGPEFQGDPLEHLYAELLDGLNYVTECEKQGRLTLYERSHIEVRLYGLAEIVRDRLRKSSTPDPMP